MKENIQYRTIQDKGCNDSNGQIKKKSFVRVLMGVGGNGQHYAKYMLMREDKQILSCYFNTKFSDFVSFEGSNIFSETPFHLSVMIWSDL